MDLLPDQDVRLVGQRDGLLWIEFLHGLVKDMIQLLAANASEVLFDLAAQRFPVNRLGGTDWERRAEPGKYSHIELPGRYVFIEKIIRRHCVDGNIDVHLRQ